MNKELSLKIVFRTQPLQTLHSAAGLTAGTLNIVVVA